MAVPVTVTSGGRSRRRTSLAVVQSVRAPRDDLEPAASVDRGRGRAGRAGRDRAVGIGSRSWWLDDTEGSALHRRDPSTAGIVHRYDGGSDFFVGGGVAAFDCNEDGRDDLYFAGGSQPAALYRNESPVGGALRFDRRPSPVTDLVSVTGAYPLDIDGDGHTDLAVLRRGGNVILRGLGDCRFERANDRFGIDGGHAWAVGFSATWEGANALPTLAFANYLVPGTYDCDKSELVRPAPATGRYAPPIVLRTRATARCPRCSATGPGRENATSAWRTTGTTTAPDPSSCGRSPRAKRRASTPSETVGDHCSSGGWASPART